MLTVSEIELTLPKGEKLNQSMGSIMHGVLMDVVDSEWAEDMHREAVRPYSQYLRIKDGRIIWSLQTLTEEAFDHLVVPMMKCTAIHSAQRGYDIGLTHFQIQKQTSWEKLERSVWVEGEQVHHVDLRFITSTSFKSNGEYAIFPMPSLLYRNLIRKWNAFSNSSVLQEEHLADHLAQDMRVTDYQLHMHPFSVERTRINAFRGTLRLGYFTNDTSARMTAMLSAFAEYAGMGIKTALGMGGIEIDISFWKQKEIQL